MKKVKPSEERIKERIFADCDECLDRALASRTMHLLDRMSALGASNQEVSRITHELVAIVERFVRAARGSSPHSTMEMMVFLGGIFDDAVRILRSAGRKLARRASGRPN